MKSLEIYPSVVVYSGLFNDSEGVIEYHRKNNEWRDWFTFGSQTDLKVFDYSFNEFPSADTWNSIILESISNKNYQSIEVLDIFYRVTSDYFNNYLPDQPSNWKFMAPQICKYKTNGGADDNVGMFYHTDFQQANADAPGPKPVMTCTMYLNDDYEGGEICFKVLKEDGVSVDYFEHKPKAGDVLVFPSGPPYYHGVNKTTAGEKYFVRSFWYSEYGGTKEWKENESKYGKKVWAEMEEARQKEEILTGKYNLKGVDH